MRKIHSIDNNPSIKSQPPFRSYKVPPTAIAFTPLKDFQFSKSLKYEKKRREKKLFSFVSNKLNANGHHERNKKGVVVLEGWYFRSTIASELKIFPLTMMHSKYIAMAIAMGGKLWSDAQYTMALNIEIPFMNAFRIFGE